MVATQVTNFCMRLLVPFFLLAALQSALVHAQSGISQYLRDLPGYQLRQVSENEGGGQAQVGPFDREILDEYILRSHSKWLVDTEGSEKAVFEMEVYEMEDEVGAFGLFSIWDNFEEQAPERLNLIVDNEYWDQTLIFWRGKYVFYLRGPTGASVSKEVFRSLAEDLIKKIPLLNLHPLTVIYLPTEGLRQDSIRVYLGKASFALDDYFPDSMASAIGFENQIEVSHARYEPEGRGLYLVAYPTIELAAGHFAKLQNAMQSYFSPEGVYMKRSGVLIPIFFGPEAAAQNLLSKVEYVPSIKWIYRKDEEADLRAQARREVTSFLQVLARSLLLTLVFAAVTIGGGCAAGLLRYGILQRFPGIRKRDEMIRLGLADRS